jgi:hypothetical protein
MNSCGMLRMAMKIHLIGRLAILAVCLIALGIISLMFGTINNNQTVRRLGSLLVVLSVILSKSSHVRLVQYRARKQAAHHAVNRLLTRAVLYRVPILCGSI